MKILDIYIGRKTTEVVPCQSVDIMPNNLFHWTCFNKTQTIDNRDVKLFKQIKKMYDPIQMKFNVINHFTFCQNIVQSWKVTFMHWNLGCT